MAEIVIPPSKRERPQGTATHCTCVRCGFYLAAGFLSASAWGATDPQKLPIWTESFASPTFEANVGQFDGTYAARAVAAGAAIYLANGGGVTIRPARPLLSSEPGRQLRGTGVSNTTDPPSHTSKISLRGSKPHPEIVLESPSPTRSHYYIGADPGKMVRERPALRADSLPRCLSRHRPGLPRFFRKARI